MGRTQPPGQGHMSPTAHLVHLTCGKEEAQGYGKVCAQPGSHVLSLYFQGFSWNSSTHCSLGSGQGVLGPGPGTLPLAVPLSVPLKQQRLLSVQGLAGSLHSVAVQCAATGQEAWQPSVFPVPTGVPEGQDWLCGSGGMLVD